MRGRSVILTGATGGLGRVIAKRLGEAGARITLAVRDVGRGRELAARIPGSQVRELDLADLSSVRRFAESWDRRIDVLINNAAVMMVPEGRTADGAELQIGTNHLGHFALTNLLLPAITDRVVTVVSKAHVFGRIDLDDLHWRRRRYSPMGAYAQSKLANLLFTRELQRRLAATGSRLALAADPGFAATDLARHTERPLLDVFLGVGIRLAAQGVERSARPILAATAADVGPATWIGPDGPFGLRGRPAVVRWPPATTDTYLGQRLWDLSARETGTDFAPVSTSVT
ncbi:SDR family NAD(P)-dependent oxidoreductase [Naumannella cuiyingiana]|uniref:SDR family NAD(P)-dependent oxidoreductase n=1 Tax=Naumannella cuiyingiana TaxID=1347891 RepID=UPI001FE41896|nr:SDR family NAD(P)-dependent oxidoreductase [Naumannella cuiyingiana]